MLQYGEIVFRTVVSLAILVFMARVMGRRTVAQLTLYDYVLGLVFGSIGGAFAVDRAIPVLDGVISLTVCVLWVMIVDWVIMNHVPARKLVDPEPDAVIYRGRILEERLRRHNYTMNNLLELLREHEIFDPRDVELGVIESDGQLSVIRRSSGPEASSAAPSQSPDSPNLSLLTGRALILEGKIVNELFGPETAERLWLQNSLATRGIKLDDVMVALLTPKGELYIDLKSDSTT